MEEHKLARLLDQFQSMRRAAMSSAFGVAATQQQAGKAATAAAIAEKIGSEIPDAATLNLARKAAIRSSSRTYDAPSIELPMAATSDEVARMRMERNSVDFAYTVLVPFLRNRIRDIPLQKFKLLSRWAQHGHDSASVERLGPRFTRFLAVLNDAFEDAKTRLSRLTQPVVQPRAPHLPSATDSSLSSSMSTSSKRHGGGGGTIPLPSFSVSSVNDAQPFLTAVQAAGAAHASLPLLTPPPFAYNCHPLPFSTSSLPNPSSGLQLPLPQTKEADKAHVLRSELVLPSDIALYLAWQIDHQRATAAFERLSIKLKWIPSSTQIDWVKRAEFMLSNPTYELSPTSTPPFSVGAFSLRQYASKWKARAGLIGKLAASANAAAAKSANKIGRESTAAAGVAASAPTTSLGTAATVDTVVHTASQTTAESEKKAETQTETQAKRRAELLFHKMDTTRVPLRLQRSEYSSQCPQWVSSSASLIEMIEEYSAMFQLDHNLSEEQGFPLLFQVEQTFADLFNFQVHFDQPRPYSGADSDNLFAALSIDELADVSDYGQVTIMPVRLYLKEATWTLFNKFKSAHDNEEEVARSHFIKANQDIDSNLLSECELLNSTDVDHVSSRMKHVSEKFHLRVQYFSTLVSQLPSTTGGIVGAGSGAASVEAHLSQSSEVLTSLGGGPTHSSSHRRVRPIDLSHNLQLLKSGNSFGSGANKNESTFAQSLQSVSASVKSQLPIHQLRIFFLLRYLRTRLLKQRILYLLNFFRSIEKKLVFDDWGFAFEDKLQFFNADTPGSETSVSRNKSASATITPTPLDINQALPTMPGHSHVDHPAMAMLVSNTSSTNTTFVTPSSSASDEVAAPSISSAAPAAKTGSSAHPYFQAKVHPTHSTPPDFATISDEAFMQFLGIENRDDSVSHSQSGETIVYDPWGVPILYDAAVSDLGALMERLLAVGSKLILKERRRRESEFAKVHAFSHLAEQGQLIAENIDREQMITDLLECEFQYQFAKCQLLEVYIQAYDHVTSRETQHSLANSILKLMRAKARLNLDDPYVVHSYQSETALLRSRAHALSCFVALGCSSAHWEASCVFAGYGVVLADEDLERELSKRRTEILQSKVSFLSSQSCKVNAINMANEESGSLHLSSTSRGLDDMVRSRATLKHPEMNPRQHAANVADLLSSEHVEDLSEFHSQVADVILCIDASLDAASSRIKQTMFDAATQYAFSTHLQAVSASEAGKDDDDDSSANSSSKVSGTSGNGSGGVGSGSTVSGSSSRGGKIENGAGVDNVPNLTKLIGLRIEPCSAIESEHVAIERAVVEAFYFCWQEHSRESQAFVQSVHAQHAHVLSEELTFSNADVLNTRLRECEHQFSKADPILNYSLQFSKLISSSAGLLDISAVMSAPTPNAVAGKQLTLQIHLNALEVVTLRADLLRALYECDVLTMVYAQQAKLVGLHEEETLLDHDPIGDGPRQIYLKVPNADSHPISRSVLCASELSRKLPLNIGCANSDDITSLFLNRSACLSSFRATAQLQFAHLHSLRISVEHHEALMRLPPPIAQHDKTSTSAATSESTNGSLEESTSNAPPMFGSHRRINVLSPMPILPLQTALASPVSCFSSMQQSIRTLSTRKRGSYLVGCLHESTFLRLTHIKFPILLSCRQVYLARVDALRDNPLISPDMKEYFQHELVLDLVHNYSLLIVRALAFPAIVNNQIAINSRLREYHFSQPDGSSPFHLLSAVESRFIDPIMKERLDPEERIAIEKFRAQIERARATPGASVTSIHSLGAGDDSADVDVELPHFGILHLPDFIVSLFTEQYGESVMFALALVSDSDEESSDGVRASASPFSASANRVPSAALSLGHANRIINVVRNQLLDDSPFDPDADFSGFNLERLGLDTALRVSHYDIVKILDYSARVEGLHSIAAFSYSMEMESEKLLLRSIAKLKIGCAEILRNSSSSLKLLTYLDSFRQVAWGQWQIFLRQTHESHLLHNSVEISPVDRASRTTSLLNIERAWNDLQSRSFSSFLVSLSKLSIAASTVFLPSLPFVDPSAVAQNNDDLFSELMSTPAPLAAIDFYQKVHKSDLQSAVKLVGKSIRPDLFGIFASHAAALCRLAVAYPGIHHNGLFRHWPGASLAQASSQAHLEHHVTSVCHGLACSWLSPVYSSLLSSSELSMREISRDMKHVANQIEKRISSELMNQQSSFASILHVEQHIQSALSISQLRDAFFSQIFRRHRSVTASTLPSNASDMRKSNMIFWSQIMPAIKIRLQDGRPTDIPRIGDQSESYATDEIQKSISEQLEHFSTMHVDEIPASSASSSQSYATSLLQIDPSEQLAHTDVFTAEFDRLLIAMQFEFVQLKIARFASEDSLSSTASLISSTAAALAAGLSITWRGQPKIDDASAAKKFSFLSHFLAELSELNTPFEIVQQVRSNESDRQRRYFIVQESEINAALNRLARNLVDFSKDAIQSRMLPLLLVNNQLTHQLHRRERAILHLRRTLNTERAERDRRVNIQLTDSQFSLVIELENLRRGLRDARDELRLQEPALRAKLRNEWERKIHDLEGELLLVRNSFDAYRTEASSTLMSSLSEVRKDSLSSLADQAAPFESKRMQLALVNQDIELSEAAARSDQLHVLLLRMQALNNMKEKKLKATFANEITELRSQLAASNKLWVSVGELESRAKTLTEELKQSRILLEDKDARIAWLEKNNDALRKDVRSAGHASRGDRQLGNRSASSDATTPEQLPLLSTVSDSSAALLLEHANAATPLCTPSTISHKMEEKQLPLHDSSSFRQGVFELRLAKQANFFRHELQHERELKMKTTSRIQRLESLLLESNREQQRLLLRSHEFETRALLAESSAAESKKENKLLREQLQHLQALMASALDQDVRRNLSQLELGVQRTVNPESNIVANQTVKTSNQSVPHPPHPPTHVLSSPHSARRLGRYGSRQSSSTSLSAPVSSVTSSPNPRLFTFSHLDSTFLSAPEPVAISETSSNRTIGSIIGGHEPRSATTSALLSTVQSVVVAPSVTPSVAPLSAPLTAMASAMFSANVSSAPTSFASPRPPSAIQKPISKFPLPQHIFTRFSTPQQPKKTKDTTGLGHTQTDHETNAQSSK